MTDRTDAPGTASPDAASPDVASPDDASSNADSPDVDDAVLGAQRAFESTKDTAPATRAAWLEAIADAIEVDAERLVDLAHEESHLPVGRLKGELARTAFQLRLLGAEMVLGLPYGATIDHADPTWGMGPRPDLRRVDVPLGVVGVFGASNFPFAFSVLGGDTASALAAGCAVVHKAHPAHPRLARATASIARDGLAGAGGHRDLLTLVEGEDAGTALVGHPLVRAVGFTGSTRGGMALAKLAADRAEPIPFYGELGSTNPVFVTGGAWGARRDEVLAGWVGSVTLGMGQFCTKPGYLVVPAGDRDAVTTGLRAANPVAPHAMLSPRLREGFESSLGYLTRSSAFDVVAELPGSADAPPATFLAVPASAVLAEPDLLQHEVFGPAGVLVECDTDDEQLAVARAIGGQLTAGLHAEPGDDIAALADILQDRAGRVLYGGWPTGVTVSWAQEHGGPFPATTTPGTTSVGTAAISRFLRPIAYQDFPEASLPAPLRTDNPWGIAQRVDGELRMPQPRS